MKYKSGDLLKRGDLLKYTYESEDMEKCPPYTLGLVVEVQDEDYFVVKWLDECENRIHYINEEEENIHILRKS